jgi:hypothetical protein
MRLLLLLATFGILGTVSAQTAPDSLFERRFQRTTMDCTGCPVVGAPRSSPYLSPYEGFPTSVTVVLPDSLANWFLEHRRTLIDTLPPLP